MSSIVESVIAYWKQHGVQFLPGVSDEEITAFELKHGVELPGDMSSFFRATNGTEVPLYSGQDHDSYDFWPLTKVRPDDSYSWAMNFLDYQELSWWFAIDLTGQGCLRVGTVYLMGAKGGDPIIVARSFSEFLELYLRSDDRLYPEGARLLERAILEPDG